MSWEWRENNREKVVAALQPGKYEAILTSKEGALDALAHVAWELGVLEAVALIAVRRGGEGIPGELLLRTIAVLPFVEGVRLSAAAETLFEDAAVPLQLDYTALQVQDGFNQRRAAGAEAKGHRSRPYHPEVLRQELRRIEAPVWAPFGGKVSALCLNAGWCGAGCTPSTAVGWERGCGWSGC
jgi:hypothetical protein